MTPHQTSTAARPQSRVNRWSAVGLAILVIAAPAFFVIYKLVDKRHYARDLARARELVALGRFDEAREPLSRWLAAAPDSAEAIFLAARSALAFGLIEQGLKGLDRARSLGYEPTKVERETALALASLGRHTEAEPLLRRLSATSQIPDAQIEQALARAYMTTFQLHAAAEAIKRWIEVAPDNPLPYLWRADVGQRTNASIEQLISDYERALALDPKSREAKLGLAERRVERREFAEARGLYEQLLEETPVNPAAVLGLGRAYDGLGRAQEAEAQFLKALELDPDSVQPLLELARAAMRLGENEKALEWLDRARSLDDSEPEVHYQRALALARLNRHEEAQQERDRTAQLRAEHAEVNKILADLHAHPDDLSRKLDAARWLFAHEHPEEAIRWARVILEIDPLHRETNTLLAEYYDRRGEIGLANYYRLKLEGDSRR
jgi:tetratricopeptide (TPR) repeat protein